VPGILFHARIAAFPEYLRDRNILLLSKYCNYKLRGKPYCKQHKMQTINMRGGLPPIPVNVQMKRGPNLLLQRLKTVYISVHVV